MKLKFAAIATIAVLLILVIVTLIYKNDESEATRLTGQSTVAAVDWCAEHLVPESECTNCHPALIEGFKVKGDWCGEHGVPESHCRLCNPELKFPQELSQAKPDMSSWCAEHAVPESVCTLCHPDLVDAFKAKGDWCAEHGLPESHCRLCNPDIRFPQEAALTELPDTFTVSPDEIKVELFFRKNSPVCATNGALVQFASAETVNRAGLSVQKVFSAHLEHGIEAPAETKFNETHLTVVTISVPALVTRWLVSPGDAVAKDAVLAILNSPETAELQASLLAASADYEVQKKELIRFEELKSKNLISDSEYDREVSHSKKFQADLTSARGLLKAAGMNEKDIDLIIETGQVGNELFLRAPERGIVVERKAQLGDLLEEGNAYAMLADPNSMWIEASLSEEQIRHVSKGQTLTFTSDGQGLNRIGAKIIWVSRYLDPHSRTGIVRASVIGSSQNYQAGEFGHVTISANENTAVTLVPKDAVQWEGCCNVVFVKETEKRYRPRKVQVAEGSGPYYQIISGLKPGEEVVVDGAFLLKTELKKSSIGAGCCEVEPAG